MQRIDHFPKLENLIRTVKTLPDPPSERQWERVVEALLEANLVFRYREAQNSEYHRSSGRRQSR